MSLEMDVKTETRVGEQLVLPPPQPLEDVASRPARRRRGASSSSSGPGAGEGLRELLSTGILGQVSDPSDAWQWTPPTAEEKKAADEAKVCCRCYKPPGPNWLCKSYSACKLIHTRCLNAEVALRKKYEATKGKDVWTNMPQTDKDQLIAKNANQECIQGQRRQVLTQIESITVNDNMDLKNCKNFQNKFEFVRHLKDRWGIEEEDAKKEFDALVADPKVPTSKDERGWTTVLKYGTQSFSQGREIMHSHGLSTAQHHENVSEEGFKELTNELGSGTLAQAANFWELGNFNCLSKPVIMDRSLSGSGRGGGGGRAAGGAKKAKKEVAGVVVALDGPKKGPGPAPLSAEAAAKKAQSNAKAEAELDKVRRINRACNLIDKWQTRIKTCHSVVMASKLAASGREHFCQALPLLDKYVEQMDAMINDDPGHRARVLDSSDQEVATALRGEEPSDPQCETFDAVMVSKERAISKTKIQATRQLTQAKQQKKNDVALAKAEAKLEKERAAQKKRFSSMFARWPVLGQMQEASTDLGHIEGHGVVALSKDGPWQGPPNVLRVINQYQAPDAALMEGFLETATSHLKAVQTEAGAQKPHMVEGSTIEHILPEGSELYENMCHHVGSLGKALQEDDLFATSNQEDIQKMLQLRLQVTGPSFEWCGLTDRCLPLVKFVLVGTENIIMAASVHDVLGLLPIEERADIRVGGLCSTFMETDLDMLQSLPSFSCCTAVAGSLVILPPASIIYEAAVDPTAVLQGTTVTRDSMSSLGQEVFDAALGLSVDVEPLARRITLGIKFVQMLMRWEDDLELQEEEEESGEEDEEQQAVEDHTLTCSTANHNMETITMTCFMLTAATCKHIVR